MKFLMNVIVAILLTSLFSGCIDTELTNEEGSGDEESLMFYYPQFDLSKGRTLGQREFSTRS